MMPSFLTKKKAGLLTLLFLLQVPAFAHVKWFSSFTFIDEPLSLSEIITPQFMVFAVICTLGVGFMVFVDHQLLRLPQYHAFEKFLDRYANKSDLIIRIATGAVLLLSWQSGTWLVPELAQYSPLVEFAQLTLALLIVSNRLTRYAGFGVIILFLIALFNFGFLHLFDYVYLVGAGYYLIVANSKKKNLRASALPALYASVGFSLCWVAIEKIVYPQWALSIFADKPYLTMGFDPGFFLLSAAFVEFSLGFLLIVCLLQRPIALAITMLFISTTLVFGKLEFVGHAIVHAALIVFLLRGTGTTFRTPITFFYHIHQRIIFAILSFSIMLMILLPWYTHAAQKQYEIAMSTKSEDPHDIRIEMDNLSDVPSVELQVSEDDHSGFNVFLNTSNFEFSPENCGEEHMQGYGHAHLYINKQKVARIYSPWYHLSGLRPGEYEISVTLNSNNHGMYTLNGRPISHSTTLIVAN